MSAIPELDGRARKLVARRYVAAFGPPPDESIPAWARENVTLDKTSPISGAYRVENSPYAVEWFEAWQDSTVRMITTIGPNQGGRTKAMEVAALWSFVHRPGPTQYNGKDNKKAAKQAETRFWPMMRNCPPVAAKLPADTRIKNPRDFVMTDGMPFVIQGANEGNLQEVSVMTQFNDECFQWDTGMLETAWKRCEISYAWNHKIWNGSTGGTDGDDISEAFKDADMREWSFQCLNRKCKHGQPFKWGGPNERGGVKWDSNEKTRPGGVWDFEALRETVRYECEKCGHRHADRLGVRRLMNDSGFYKPTKENQLGKPIKKNGRIFYPFRKKVSFRYNALAINWPGVSWAQFVEQYLKAVFQARHYANYHPLRIFWQRIMGEFWDESKFVHVFNANVVSDYDYRDKETGVPVYMAEKWEGECKRFMAVDKQEVGYYYVIRAVRSNGESRLIDRGELDSYDHIENKAEEFGIPKVCVVIDCGYETREVYAAAIKKGWTCLRGDDRTEWIHFLENPKTKQKVKVSRPYSPATQGDPGFKFEDRKKLQSKFPGVVLPGSHMPRYARVLYFSNLEIKDILAAFKQGRAAIYWGLPGDVGKEYRKQINSEVRYKKTKQKGGVEYWWSNCGPDGKQRKKPNHYWDCEVMLMVCFIVAKLIDLEKFQGEVTASTNEVSVFDDGEEAAAA